MMKKLSSLVFLILFSFSAFPQQNDAQIWSSLSFRKKIIKGTTATFKQGLRFRENATIKSKVFSDIKVRHKYNKDWAGAIGFRFSKDWNKRMHLEDTYRYYGDVIFMTDVDRFNISVRSRLQQQGNDLDSYSWTFRQKIECTYNIRKTKLEPSSALEYFYTEKERKVDKIRGSIGISYPMSKDLALEFLYRLQKDINNTISNGELDESETLFIFEGRLSYKL